MSYLLYLRRSFTRTPRRHAVLLAVLSCAFLLPLLICIYRDSNAWGPRGNSCSPALRARHTTSETQRRLSCRILRASPGYPSRFSVTALSICTFCRTRNGRIRRAGSLLKTSLASALRPRATRLCTRARSATNTPTGYPTTHLIFRGSGLCCLSMCWSSCCRYRCCAPLTKTI